MNWYTIPAIWRAVYNPIPIYARLNSSLGLSVWRPRNTIKFFI